MRKKLTENIKSYKDNVIYGKRGDLVTIIRDCGNVCIVECIDGERFPVKKCKLIDEEVEVKKEAVPDATAQNKPIINRVPVSKKKAVPINQQSLF